MMEQQILKQECYSAVEEWIHSDPNPCIIYHGSPTRGHICKNHVYTTKISHNLGGLVPRIVICPCSAREPAHNRCDPMPQNGQVLISHSNAVWRVMRYFTNPFNEFRVSNSHAVKDRMLIAVHLMCMDHTSDGTDLTWWWLSQSIQYISSVMQCVVMEVVIREQRCEARLGSWVGMCCNVSFQ